MPETILHGTAVLVKGDDFPPSAVFLRGPSGSGKSDLAFRLLQEGGVLVCDDQVHFELRQGRLMATPVETIRGLIEVRGVGLLRQPVSDAVPVALVVDLVPLAEVPRLPEWESADILGIQTPCLKLHAFESSAPAKVRAAIGVVHHPENIIK